MIILVLMVSGVVNLLVSLTSTGEPTPTKDNEVKETETVELEKKKEDEPKKEEKAEEPKEEEKKEVSQEEWNEFKTKFLEHYGEAGILDLQENPGSDYTVFNVYVPNEFKINTEEEKQYYVEEIGPFMQEDLEAQFPDSELIHVYFKYQDDNTMAKAKMFGGWKIR